METPHRLPEGSANHEPKASPSEDGFAAGRPPIEFHLDEALARFGGDRDLFAEMVEHFLNESPAMIDAMRQGIEGNDLPAAARAAHRLKGTVGYFGVAPLIAAATHIEEASKASHREWAEDVLAQLVQQVASLRQILTLYRPARDV